MENRGRMLVQYSAFKFDAAWRRLSDEQRTADKEEFAAAVEQAADEMTVRSYSLVGVRQKADAMLHRI